MMRILIALLLVSFTVGMATANDLFQSSNPFGDKINSSPSLNNIYETTPDAMEQEKKTDEKVKKSRWWKVKEDTSEVIQAPAHQRAEDSGFILFK